MKALKEYITEKKDPIAEYAEKENIPVEHMRKYIWKIKDRFYRYDLTDSEALGVYRKFTKARGVNSFDGWLEYLNPVDALGAKRAYKK